MDTEAMKDKLKLAEKYKQEAFEQMGIDSTKNPVVSSQGIYIDSKKLFEHIRIEMIAGAPLPVSQYHSMYNLFNQRQQICRSILKTQPHEEEVMEYSLKTLEYCEAEIKKFLLL